MIAGISQPTAGRGALWLNLGVPHRSLLGGTSYGGLCSHEISIGAPTPAQAGVARLLPGWSATTKAALEITAWPTSGRCVPTTMDNAPASRERKAEGNLRDQAVVPRIIRTLDNYAGDCMESA